MSDEPLEFTNLIQSWLAASSHDNQTIDEVTRFALTEVRNSIINGPESDDEAATALHSCLQERLCVDPGVAGPFGSLSADLLATVLDTVDWIRLIRWVRYGESEEAGTEDEDQYE